MGAVGEARGSPLVATQQDSQGPSHTHLWPLPTQGWGPEWPPCTGVPVPLAPGPCTSRAHSPRPLRLQAAGWPSSAPVAGWWPRPGRSRGHRAARTVYCSVHRRERDHSCSCSVLQRKHRQGSLPGKPTKTLTQTSPPTDPGPDPAWRLEEEAIQGLPLLPAASAEPRDPTPKGPLHPDRGACLMLQRE